MFCPSSPHPAVDGIWICVRKRGVGLEVLRALLGVNRTEGVELLTPFTVEIIRHARGCMPVGRDDHHQCANGPECSNPVSRSPIPARIG
jgi:hypothetical protein